MVDHIKSNKERNKKIKAEMAMKDYTRSDLSKLLGISERSVQYKLRGKSPWTIKEVEDLSYIFNKDRRYFF